MHWQVPELAYETIKRGTVALLCEPPGQQAYIFSGCVVDYEDEFLWFTAAHCATTIVQLKAIHPNTLFTFVPLASTRDSLVVLRGDEIAFVNMQEVLENYRTRWPEVSIDDDEVDKFDIAFMVVPTLRKLYLLNENVRGFSRTQLSVSAGHFQRAVELELPMGFFVSGIPEESHEELTESSTIRFDYKLMPLHPDPDSSPDLADRREMDFDGQFTWIPTNWSHTEWGTHVRGISGGPATLLIGDSVHVIGVATKQEPPPFRSPKYIGVTSIQPVVMILDMIYDGKLPGEPLLLPQDAPS